LNKENILESPGILKTEKIKISEENSILLVDDDNFVCNLIERILNDAGFKNIRTASNGKAALEILGITSEADNKNANGVDLIILDVLLPDTNGFEICRQIRSSNLDIPVILISGYDIEEIQSRLIECKADDFLKKPFSPAELATRVKILLNRNRQRKDDYTITETAKIRMKTDHSVPFVGDDINGYIIIDSLGWGKNSLVYKVVKVKGRTVYSMKMLTKTASDKKDLLERFKNEVEIISKIKHPNVTGFIDRGYYNECPYLVMDFVDGVDLEEYMVTRGKIPIKSFTTMAFDIASAISELHRSRIYHRDIKLKNILYDIKTGKVKLSDFGIAKLPESLHITQEGFIVGTPIYLAPEIFMGEAASPQSDIYSYGATLYHLLTGSPPFVAETSIELFKKHRLEKPSPIETFRSDAPKGWNSLIVDKCLAKDIINRPSSMNEVMYEINKLKAAL
jgi:CheY-like chemotaxis protein/tRNA A-37 threonylcarbamoyl transferase component Bud32